METKKYRETPWMTVNEAADYLSLSRGTIRNFVHRRRIPFYRNRGVVRFHAKDLDDWLEAGRQQPTESSADDNAGGET